MKARVAKKLVVTATVSAVVALLAACDLGLEPFVASTDAGPIVVDTGTPVIVAETGAADTGADAADAATGPKRIFVTSLSYFGDFSRGGGAPQPGQAGADAICQGLATKAGLGGTFVAWVSEATKNAIDHIKDVGPWYLVDRKTMVFPNKAGILSFPLVPINKDETGATVVAAGTEGRVWTGTLGTGVPDTSAGANFANQSLCANWTTMASNGNFFGLFGSVGETSSRWTASNLDGCAQGNRLYCFEQ